MTLILIAIVGSTVLGLICRGRLGRLNRPPLSRGGLILIALLGQVVAMLAHSDGVLLMWLIGSVLAAAFYYLANRGRLGLILVIIGFGLNALCAALNSALPMSVDAAHRAGLAVSETQLEQEYVAEPINDSTVLPWLGQIIPVPLPHWSTVATVGDATAAAGFAVFMFTGVTGRGRTIPKTPEEEKAEKKEGRAQRRKARADAKAGKTVVAAPEFPLDFHDEESDRRAAERSRELIGAGVGTSPVGATARRDSPGGAETPGKPGRTGRKGRDRKAGKGARSGDSSPGGDSPPAQPAARTSDTEPRSVASSEPAVAWGSDAAPGRGTLEGPDVRAFDPLPAPAPGAAPRNGSGPVSRDERGASTDGGATVAPASALAAEPKRKPPKPAKDSADVDDAGKKLKNGLTKAERVEARRAKKAANAAKAAAAAIAAAAAAPELGEDGEPATTVGAAEVAAPSVPDAGSTSESAGQTDTADQTGSTLEDDSTQQAGPANDGDDEALTPGPDAHDASAMGDWASEGGSPTFDSTSDDEAVESPGGSGDPGAERPSGRDAETDADDKGIPPTDARIEWATAEEPRSPDQTPNG